MPEPKYEQYQGPQCQQCGKEGYTLLFVCSECNDLICFKCLDAHTACHKRPGPTRD